jgi:hypothetical protein
MGYTLTNFHAVSFAKTSDKELKDTEHGGVANPRISRCGVASQG